MDNKDKLIEKMEEYLKYILKYACTTDSDKSIRMTRFESEILSLKKQVEQKPLDVPSEGEIEKEFPMKHSEICNLFGWNHKTSIKEQNAIMEISQKHKRIQEGAKWAITEIIKRNKCYNPK